MADSRATQPKVTYATLSAGQTPEFNKAYDEAAERVRKDLGRTYSNLIGGREVAARDTFPDTSPSDTRVVLGRFASGSRDDARAAIAAARKAYESIWRDLPWKERVGYIRKVAAAIERHRYDLSALLSMEVGKNRLEAMGDVQETADLMSYYCDQVEEHGGFETPMQTLSEKEANRDVLRPYGVWVIISPFNFPMALSGGPSSGALLGGNTVILKPASDAPLTGYRLAECYREAGLPDGVFNFITGPGSTVGDELVNNPGVDGILFTGSKQVGFGIYRDFAKDYPKPCITEMGGKNPALVTATADLDVATDGVLKSAFGLQGQKCSACSRVYVDRKVAKAFTDLLVDKTRKIVIGDPVKKENWLGPVINKAAYENYARYTAIGRKDGRILVGGEPLKREPYDHGYFVQPTVIGGLPQDHALSRDEMFLPITCVWEVASLDEALTLANRTEYGLTAGLFSTDQKEIDTFFNRIEAGVVYVNRRAGATTGAWPGVNPFGGWKGSGSSGKASGGPYYVAQFMREQSRTLIRG
ncbi:MAG TPA: aldehyde dehydrogenase family protein [Candidatus Polarisedimenticolia bacterium]|nr:aldehyde dehydrogenase family protein [Candidatus Polarisedimenticolia bacterium]